MSRGEFQLRMGLTLELLGQVTTRAYGIAFPPHLQAVRIVTILTGNTFTIHLALQKGPVDVNLILDLPVRVIERILQQRRTVRIHKRPPVNVPIGHHGSTGVTPSTAFDLDPRRPRNASFRQPSLHVHDPSGLVSILQPHDQPVPPSPEPSPLSTASAQATWLDPGP